MLYSCSQALTFFATLSLFAAQANAELMVYFDTENSGVGQSNYESFQDFEVTSGAVDLIGSGLFDFYPGNGLYVDLNGTTNESGTLRSKTLFQRGSYQLSFSIANNPLEPGENFLTVSLGSFTETFSRTGAANFVEIQRLVSVQTPDYLEFATPIADSDRGGILIDNVSLNVSAVPEPSTVLLFAGITSVLALTRRRRIGDFGDIRNA